MMNLFEACNAIALARPANSALVSTMGAMHGFDRHANEANLAADDPARASRLSSVPLMGGAAGLGLGLAMAHPDRNVIVVDGDASLLLELSGLVTVAMRQPKHYLHVVIKNGTQFTGLANLQAPHGQFNFAGAAANAGYGHVETISDLGQWQARLPALLAMTGPVFVELLVEPLPQRAGTGFVQEQMPDLQFERMGKEALALSRFLGASLTEGQAA